MSQATSGVGAQFQVGDGNSPEVFTKVAEVTSISGPELTAEPIDVTSLDSTGGYKEFIPGFLDSGSVQLEVNFIATNQPQTDLRTRVSTVGQAAQNYRIILPDTGATQIDFAAIVESFSITAESGSQITASISLKISGPTTWS